MRPRPLLLMLALCIVALLILSGCASGLVWDAQAGTLTTAQLKSKLDGTDASKLRRVAVTEAHERRNHALASIRKEEGGSQVADVLTTAFSGGNAGVPLYIGVGTFSGEKVIIVIEAYGSKGGTLDHKRLWVLSMSGSPLFSTASR